MKSGRTLWDELVVHYDTGIATVGEMRKTWAAMASLIGPSSAGLARQSATTGRRAAAAGEGALHV